MTTPQNAFAPGSVATNAAAGALRSALGAGGVPGVGSIPGFQSSSSADSRSGDALQSLGLDFSGFSVNYGNGVNQSTGGGGSGGTAPPQWLWLAAAAVVGVVAWKKYA